MPQLLVPFFWYASAEDFDAIRRASADGELLPDTYSEWLERADQGLQKMRASGHTAFKAEIRAQEFIAWCAERRLNIDSEARTEYAGLLAAAWHRQQNPVG